jgi:molybdate transport system ATP-binding protein
VTLRLDATVRADGRNGRAARVGRTTGDDFAVTAALTVEAGETVAVVGPNGAGKSTVLAAIAGLLPVSSGHITVGDEVWDDASTGTFVPPRERRVGLVFQDYALFDHLSALDNVAFGLRAGGERRGAARAAARDCLERFGVAAVADRRPTELSGGQAQRVALARAVAISPSVLLLDEPLAALDATARAVIRHDLRRGLDDAGLASTHRIVVTHDPADAYALADRVVVIESGRVTQRGTLAELAAAPRSTYVADLVGTNLLRGELHGSRFRTDDGAELTVGAHAPVDGPALLAIRPASVSLHRHRPEGSPRNVWSTTVVGVDHGADRVRVRLGGPLALAVEVTPAGYTALDVEVGDAVWASVKASEIGVEPD